VFNKKDMTFPNTLIDDAVVRSIRGSDYDIGVSSLNEKYSDQNKNKYKYNLNSD